MASDVLSEVQQEPHASGRISITKYQICRGLFSSDLRHTATVMWPALLEVGVGVKCRVDRPKMLEEQPGTCLGIILFSKYV